MKPVSVFFEGDVRPAIKQENDSYSVNLLARLPTTKCHDLFNLAPTGLFSKLEDVGFSGTFI